MSKLTILTEYSLIIFRCVWDFSPLQNKVKTKTKKKKPQRNGNKIGQKSCHKLLNSTLTTIITNNNNDSDNK